MQRISAFEMFAVLSKCGFHHKHCQCQSESFLFEQPVSFEKQWRILM